MAYSYDGYLRFGTKVDQSGFDKGVNSLKSAASIGAKAVAVSLGAATGAVTALSVASIRAGSNFEEGMSKVSAISGATASDLQALADKAKEMGATTKFSATQSAEALQYMAMAGWKTEQMLSGLPGVMNLAAASGEDLASVSDIVTDAMTAFGLKAEESGRFADVLAAASSNANTNVGMMGATFKYVAPVAGSLGYNIEDTAVAIGLMANAGIKGEMAGTQLRATLTRLAKPTKDSAAAMDALGMSLTNNDGTMKSFDAITRDLRNGMAGLTEEQQATYAAMLGGQEAMSGLLAIANASEEDFNKLTAAIDNSAGAAEKMAKTANDNLKGDLTVLGSTAESVGIKIYEKFETPMRKAAQSATDSLGDVLRSLNNGQLDKSVDKIADAAGNLLAKTAELTANGLPKLLDGFTFILDNGRKIEGTILSIGAAYGVFKTASTISNVSKSWKTATKVVSEMKTVTTGSLTAMQTAAALYTKKITLQTAATSLATKSQLGLNAAVLANPATWLVGGIAALTAGLFFLDKQQSETEKSTKKLNEALEEQRQAREEVEKERQKAIDGAVAEIDHAASLIDKYESITDANGKIKEGYEGRAKALQEQINSIIPNAISLSEREGDMYLQVADDLGVLIEKKKINALIDANKDAYAQAISNQNENVDKLRDANEKLAESKENLKKIDEEYAKAVEEGKIIVDIGPNNLERRKKAAEDAVTAAKDAVNNAETVLNDGAEMIAKQEGLIVAAHSNNVDEMKAATESLLSDTVNYTNKSKDEMDKQLSDATGNYEALLNLTTEKGGEINDAEYNLLLEKRKTLQTEVDAYLATGEKIPENLAQGILNTEATFKSSIENLFRSGKIDHEQYVKLMGTVGSNWGNALAESSDNEEVIGKIKNAAENNANTAIDSINKVWKIENKTSGAGNEVGGYYADGVAKGMISEASLRKIRANGTILGQTADRATRKALKIESPSKVGIATGGFYPEGVALGIIKNKHKVVEAVQSMSNDAIKTAKEKATSYKEIGSIYIKKMEDGIEKRKENLLDEIETLVEDQVDKFKEESESKETKQDYEKAANAIMDTYKTALNKGADEAKALLSGKIKGITEEAQKQYDEIIKQRERMQEKLSGFGDLFTRDDDGEVQLENIEKQTDALERYQEVLEKLQEKGISEGLLNEIIDMGVEDGTDFAEELLSKSDSTFERYNQAWTEKQELAKTVAEKFYADELETLDNEFTQKLDTALADIPVECTNVGMDAIQGVIDGMESQKEDAVQTARDIADAIIKELKRATETASPSKRAAREVGKPITQGVVKGMKDAYNPKEMERYADRMMADVGMAQSRAAAQSILNKNISNVWRTSTYNEGDFNPTFNIKNGDKETVRNLMEESEFYRRQRVKATGGA